MGISYTSQRDGWTGGIQREVVVEATFDDSYTNGGEALTPTALQNAGISLSKIENVTIESGLTSGGNAVEWDPDNEVLVVYDGSHSELANGSGAIDGQTVRLSVRGRS